MKIQDFRHRIRVFATIIRKNNRNVFLVFCIVLAGVLLKDSIKVHNAESLSPQDTENACYRLMDGIQTKIIACQDRYTGVVCYFNTEDSRSLNCLRVFRPSMELTPKNEATP